MAKSKTKKQNKELGVGGIIALVIAGLALIGILAGVVLYVHSGRAGMGQSAGLLTANNATELPSEVAATTEAVGEDEVVVTMTDKAGNVVSAVSKKESTTKYNEDTPQEASAGVKYLSKATAKELGTMYDADVDAFRKAYDGKPVTVTGKLSGKSAKMLYVELATGTKVPMRAYLNSEELREQFNALKEGKTITIKGTMAVLYPESVDAGGFQEMANGLIALESVSLVK